jgi:tRNA(Ile)-lysidine synthase
MLSHKSKELLSSSKNLLAFSAGVDSTALFFILKECNIPFDIAIVDYALRSQSKEEVAYAKELAKEHNLRCFVKQAPKIEKNFEANARKIRYDFFHELIKRYEYDNLLTAHHLGDKLEWFLMQLCKGAGTVELSGMQTTEKRTNYTLIRPLLHHDKDDLLAYLEKNKIKYFIDTSNYSPQYKRNYFRAKYATPLLKEYKQGILKSFAYLENDRALLIEELPVHTLNKFTYFQHKNNRSDIYHIDQYLKTKGLLMSAQERELLQKQKSLVIGRKYIVTQIGGYICIAPYLRGKTLTKEFKEKMRKLKIDPKIRPYLAIDPESEALLSFLFS